MLQPGMVRSTARLSKAGLEQQVNVNLIINNRAGGNAPMIAREVVLRFLELREDALLSDNS